MVSGIYAVIIWIYSLSKLHTTCNGLSIPIYPNTRQLAKGLSLIYFSIISPFKIHCITSALNIFLCNSLWVACSFQIIFLFLHAFFKSFILYGKSLIVINPFNFYLRFSNFIYKNLFKNLNFSNSPYVCDNVLGR